MICDGELKVGSSSLKRSYCAAVISVTIISYELQGHTIFIRLGVIYTRHIPEGGQNMNFT